MTLRTITFDDEQWQVVPKVATERMILELMAVGLRNAEYANEGPAVREMAQGYACMLAAAPEPPAQQPMTEDEIDEETRAATDALMDYIYEYGTGAEGSQQFIRRIARAVETHHGIGKGKSTTKRNCPPPSWMFPGESDAD